MRKVIPNDFVNQFLNAGLEKHQIPYDTSLYCDRCYHRGYVSPEEMQFLMDTHNIINNEIHTPGGMGKVPRDENGDIRMSIGYKHVEYVYVSRFCPHCDREKFGSLSDWRE